jgi:hypothetical protein
MADSLPFFPHAVFSGNSENCREAPCVLISPYRYIQGVDVLDHIGRYLSTVSSCWPAVLSTAGGKAEVCGAHH